MNVDLAPTFLDLANLAPSSAFDGMTFKPILEGQPHPFRATVLVEYHGEQEANVNNCPKLNNQGLYECDAHCVCRDGWNNTYGCIRYETQQESYKYCAMQDNDVKLIPQKITNYYLQTLILRGRLYLLFFLLLSILSYADVNINDFLKTLLF
ncbi:hypothetical protein Btru_020554 [Bulinus truncatus]|nr:hypothetical protein Btru_020554 [Bulinus truncatus]